MCDCKKGYSTLSNCEGCDFNHVKDNKGFCVCGYIGINCQECDIGYMNLKEENKSSGTASQCVCENGNYNTDALVSSCLGNVNAA